MQRLAKYIVYALVGVPLELCRRVDKYAQPTSILNWLESDVSQHSNYYRVGMRLESNSQSICNYLKKHIYCCYR